MTSFPRIRIPAEWEAHSCCWMAWAVHKEWGADIKQVKRELRNVIVAISQYEPVSLLTPKESIAEAKQQSFGANVDIVPAPVDDIWMRDIAPTFGKADAKIISIDWNFNGWGSTVARRSRPGDRLAATVTYDPNILGISAPFIGEGGAFITDGEGTVITTKSCILNENRNPAYGQTIQERMTDIEAALSKFGGNKIIWLEGDKTELVTSGHIDGYALINRPGSIIVEGIDPSEPSTLYRGKDIRSLKRAIDAKGRTFRVTEVLPPRQRYLRFSGSQSASCYLNAYVANGAVIAAKFGDPERDEAARRVLEIAFPGREVRMITVDHIAAGGGGIRCLTQPMPLAG